MRGLFYHSTSETNVGLQLSFFFFLLFLPFHNIIAKCFIKILPWRNTWRDEFSIFTLFYSFKQQKLKFTFKQRT